MKSGLLAATLAACLWFPVAQPSAAMGMVADAPLCMEVDTVPGAVLDAPLLVFGEVHGTREVPAFLIGYLCAAAKQQRRITLAVEFPSSEQSAIDAFMAGRGTPQDAEQFTGTAFWRRPLQDGRTSVDMLRLFENVRALRAGGTDIKLIAIDSNASGARRDALMAEHLRAALRQGPGRQLVALIGGLHAIRSKGTRFNPQQESAVYLLADQRPLSLTVGTAGGTAWVCQGGAPASCHATAWDINRVTPAPATPFSLVPPSPQFDGVFFVGATTAPPPAVAN
ncbi:hypothetical protein [Massilia aerilata]|uniref:Haem-binding uptake Tiki superfamily ChaN domain-containing protein n=1 Tax=Massilia aerilata TaxID=453817 RepID=A0ABW0RTA2_9BURK